MRPYTLLFPLILAVGPGCGDDSGNGPNDAAPEPDGGMVVDGAVDSDQGSLADVDVAPADRAVPPGDANPHVDQAVDMVSPVDISADTVVGDVAVAGDVGTGADSVVPGDGAAVADSGSPLPVDCTRDGVSYSDTNRPLPASTANWGTISLPIPDSAYDWNNDMTLDKQTCLVWKRTHESGLHDWSGAKALCKNLSFAGRTDWRLPTKAELLSIQDKSKSSRPYCNTNAFPDLDNWFWSSTPIPSTQHAYVVGFGMDKTLSYPKTNKYWVTCVR